MFKQLVNKTNTKTNMLSPDVVDLVSQYVCGFKRNQYWTRLYGRLRRVEVYAVLLTVI